MIEKKDWEIILKNSEEDKAKVVKNYEMSIPQLDCLIELVKKKIAEFPEEKADEMPQDLKEDLKEIAK